MGRAVRALVVSNMQADAAHPARGSFVRDQVAALRELGEAEIELYEFAPGPRALARAAAEMPRRFGARWPRRAAAEQRFDVVHAHFGLSAWPALVLPTAVRALTVHGNDLAHPRTRLATTAVIPQMDVLGAVSTELVQRLPGERARRRALVLPCGVALDRFRAIPRAQARAELALEPDARLLLFPADPRRPEKRFERAHALADAAGARLLSLGDVAPERVPLWVNAADAVLVTSEREGFGLAVLEALACEVPVLATPVGIHREALDGIPGTLCAPFELERWREALESLLSGSGPGEAGRQRAERYSARTLAARVLKAWRAAL